MEVASTEAVPLNMELGVGRPHRNDQRSRRGAKLRCDRADGHHGQAIADGDVCPTSRTLTAALGMAPNVKPTGPDRAPAVTTGRSRSPEAMSYDSVFLLNGVAITENVRGQPFTLFIEDAIQETTVSTSGISAEYGRFGGGLVNAITKSGGNQFSGSYRLGMNNDDWRAITPFHETKLDKVDTHARVHDRRPHLQGCALVLQRGTFPDVKSRRFQTTASPTYLLRTDRR